MIDLIPTIITAVLFGAAMGALLVSLWRNDDH